MLRNRKYRNEIEDRLAAVWVVEGRRIFNDRLSIKSKKGRFRPESRLKLSWQECKINRILGLEELILCFNYVGSWYLGLS